MTSSHCDHFREAPLKDLGLAMRRHAALLV
jgi:hypothetical protein